MSMQPHNFLKAIEIENTLVEFEFVTMNVKELKLFQVYFSWNNKRYRFHMQQNAKGAFYITDEHALPPGVEMPWQVLADAILTEHALLPG